MTPITLPRDDRAVLRVLRVWIGLVPGLAAGAIVWIVGSGLPAVLGASAAMLVVGLFAARDKDVRRLHHAWNNRLARPLAGWAKRYVVWVCYFIVFVAVGRAGSRLELLRGGWASRPEVSASPTGRAFATPHALGWVRRYTAWALQSGNAWSLALLPFLLLIRLLSDQEEPAFASNIYTLF
jgi:hypothetical protein